VSWLTCLDFYKNAGTLCARFSFDFALKSSLFLLVVFFLYQSVRRLPSAFRHFLLSLAFFCLSLLPFCLICGPEWRFPVLSAPVLPRTGGQSTSAIWLFLLLGIWLIGFAVVMLRLVVGVWITGRLKRESLPLDDPDWACDLERSSRRLGLRGNVRVLVNHRLGAAICAGLIKPCVIVPAEALEWSDEQRQTILHHELGHIKRRDNLTNLFSLAVCAFYWFNPLAWWAAARLRVCREDACDDLVLNCGTKPSRYVSYLLQATATPPSRFISVTLSQISVLKKRVLTILDPRVNRRAIGPAQIVACSFLAAVALMSLAALQPWIVPSLSGGLGEEFGLMELPGSRFASQLLSPLGEFEGRGQVQARRNSRLVALPPGFVPAYGPPVFADRYPTQVTTISATGNAAAPGATVQHRSSPALASPNDASWAPDYQPIGAIALGSVVGGGTQPPTDQSPAQPDTPPADTSADLSVSRLDLGTLGGTLSQASDINEAGRVVGASTDGLGKSHPFVWTKTEGMSHLPCPSGDCQAIGINNSGQVLVVASGQAASSSSYLWSPDTLMTEIGTLGGKSTRALHLNDRGEIAGTSETSFGLENTFFWSRETGMVNLGGAKPVALNEKGQVVGWASSYAFFWDPATGNFKRIGELNVKAQPFDMNNRGEVVGYAQIGKNSQPKAFYWNAVDGMTELEFPGAPALSCAFRINDAGEVLAITRDSANRERTFSWRPGQQAREQTLPDLLIPQLDWQLMSSSTSSIALIGSNLPSSKLADELAKVDFGAREEPNALAQPVKMNGRGQIAGNLVRPAVSEVEAVVWEIRLPKVEGSIRDVLKELAANTPTFSLRAELEAALHALADNDYQGAASSLATFLEVLPALDSSIPESKRTRWASSMQENLDRISHFTVLK